jgi:hypothetical protein
MVPARDPAQIELFQGDPAAPRSARLSRRPAGLRSLSELARARGRAGVRTMPMPGACGLVWALALPTRPGLDLVDASRARQAEAHLEDQPGGSGSLSMKNPPAPRVVALAARRRAT